MANFIYIEGFTPVNLDLVTYVIGGRVDYFERDFDESVFSENDISITFIGTESKDHVWKFDSKEKRDLVYNKILEQFTKIEV